MNFPTAANSILKRLPAEQALKKSLAHAKRKTSTLDEEFQTDVRITAHLLNQLPKDERAQLTQQEKQFRAMLSVQDHPILWRAAYRGAPKYSLDRAFYAVCGVFVHAKRETEPDDESFSKAVRVASHNLSFLPKNERKKFAQQENQFRAILESQNHPALWQEACEGALCYTQVKAYYALKSVLAHANRETPPDDKEFQKAVGIASLRLSHLIDDERAQLAQHESMFRTVLDSQNQPVLWAAAYNGVPRNTPDKVFYAVSCALSYTKRKTPPDNKGFQSAVSVASLSLSLVSEGDRTKSAAQEKNFRAMLNAQDQPVLWRAALKGVARYSPDKIFYALRCALSHAKHKTPPDDEGYKDIVDIASSILSSMPPGERIKYVAYEKLFDQLQARVPLPPPSKPPQPTTIQTLEP